MFALGSLRPARYGEAIIAQALADRDVDLAEVGDCRLAMIEAFGVEPDVDWALACTLAMVLRRVEAGGPA